jgi:hypothetical protein
LKRPELSLRLDGWTECYFEVHDISMLGSLTGFIREIKSGEVRDFFYEGSIFDGWLPVKTAEEIINEIPTRLGTN